MTRNPVAHTHTHIYIYYLSRNEAMIRLCCSFYFISFSPKAHTGMMNAPPTKVFLIAKRRDHETKFNPIQFDYTYLCLLFITAIYLSTSLCICLSRASSLSRAMCMATTSIWLIKGCVGQLCFFFFFFCSTTSTKQALGKECL